MAKKRGKKKDSKGSIYAALARIVNGDSGNLEKFPHVYYVTSPSSGVFQTLRQTGEDSDIVDRVPLSTLAADITKYCFSQLNDLDDYQLTAGEAKAAAELWSYLIPPVPEPRSFLWPGESGLAYVRLPWKAEAGACPTWDELMSRTSNAAAFKAWVASLFIEKSYAQQYVWIFGEGGDGKGAINNFLKGVFSHAYLSLNAPRADDKFWTYQLQGKRVVVFPDCNNTAFVASGMFKSLTGGDPVHVEAKGEMGYTASLNAKYLILSNEQPQISSERADMRRVIYCEIGKPPDNKDGVPDEFKERLWAEGGAFLADCFSIYEKMCPRHTAIETDKDEIHERVKTIEEEYLSIFCTVFEEKICQPNMWVKGHELWSVLAAHGLHRSKILSFISWLRRRGVDRVKINKDGDKAYRGITARPTKRPDTGRVIRPDWSQQRDT